MSQLAAIVFDDEVTAFARGKVFQTSLSKDDEAALREVLESTPSAV